MSSDMLNGFFECAGALMLIRNIFILNRDKKVAGLSLWSTSFFMLWGAWNAVFYPLNNLWYSFLGGILLAVSNFVWLSMALYYRNKNHAQYP